MNLFNKAKINSKLEQFTKCVNCDKQFIADKRNVNRGWGVFCSKSCAVICRNNLFKLETNLKIKENRVIQLKKLGIY
jgi:hypothetical protein